MAFKSILLVGIILLASWCAYYIQTFLSIRHIPEVNDDVCWGNECKTDTNVYPFRIIVPKRDIDDLLLRLNNTRKFTPSLENTQTQYGLNGKVIQTLLNFIKNEYNFTERQNYLNSVPQFKTNIQGINVHFIHVRSKRQANVPVVPILMLHGWPSSVSEFYESIPILTSKEYQDKFSIELVIPSLIGFGYSDGASKPGFGAAHSANIMRLLMNRLGYNKFVVHGSDWGAVTITALATLYPDSVIGLHSNFCFSLRAVTILKTLLGTMWPRGFVENKYEEKIYPFLDQLRFLFYEGAYFHLFGTKPDTIGNILDSSPLALIIYSVEKLSVGANRTNVFSSTAGLEQLDLTIFIDSILFYYWFPQKSTTAARYYCENITVRGLKIGLHNIPIDKKIPCACAYFENEIVYQPEEFLRDKYPNIIQYNTYPSIGHFAAIENNKILTEDIMSFVIKLYDSKLF
ncbi:juvenile hormone epoxide hydrolase 2-like [Diabrotica undecimpunctata]|uniref:juvenile hormone epoxide hydrolase 2-like n=1 Tax=Diabrotica undecimpunctata TaxID=50387 RepID=UPI003B640D4D